MSQILIAGATGLVGQALIRQLGPEHQLTLLCRQPGEAELDEEGRQTMRVLARNMTFLMQCIELGKRTFGLPESEPHLWTHFI